MRTLNSPDNAKWPLRPILQEEPVHRDERGWFTELGPTQDTLHSHTWAQENASFSRYGVLRGLHFQHPGGQAKLIRALFGSIMDVAVDVRRGSPEFGRASICRLEDSSPALLVPPGYAHGFLVLSAEGALVHYRCSTPRLPSAERAICWNDPDLDISWPLTTAPILSVRDASAPRLADMPPSQLPLFLPIDP
jgi:dTDP-4-dehydrorhamnose 3,5-epimerase